jgi:Sgf11 (transcriptional regulation protein)
LCKAHAILDDIFRNFLHDLLLKTHREEKIARANTAAIIVEQLAAESLPDTPSEPSSASPKKPHIIKTDEAVYEDGNVYVVGNPLRTTHEIRCPRCSFPRVLYPPITTGDQTRAPDTQYCTRLPFVDQPGHDIHGHPLTEATLKKNARLNKEKELLASKSQNQGEPGSSFESPAPSPPPEGVKIKPPKTIIPNTSCQLCKRSVQCSRFAKHLQVCMGVAGRASSRTAKLKMEEQANGSQTPPRSRKSTPLPPTKKSPQKRDADEIEEDNENEESLEKKKPKKAVAKKWKSGKVTVDGKAVMKAGEPLENKPKGKQKEIENKKELGKKETSPPRELSESSRTLSSPS